MNNNINEIENNEQRLSAYEDKIIEPKNGAIGVLVYTGLLVLIALLLVGGILLINSGMVGVGVALVIIGAVALAPIIVMMCFSFMILKPNENAVLTKFGKYVGTVNKEGFFVKNIFTSAFNPARIKSISPSGMPIYSCSKYIGVKQITLDNQKQKVNDLRGNPIEIGVIVIWKVEDSAKAVFNVENYINYVSIQADASIRTIARQYPYDDNDTTNGIEKSLRGSSSEVAQNLRDDLQKTVENAGIKIIDARISHLAYAQEIASSMLQRQQAQAVVDARKTIVEGAVGMVELALDKLRESGVVELDEERKAQMVSNLMVVLCSNKDTQPIVNTGTIY